MQKCRNEKKRKKVEIEKWENIDTLITVISLFSIFLYFCIFAFWHKCILPPRFLSLHEKIHKEEANRCFVFSVN